MNADFFDDKYNKYKKIRNIKADNLLENKALEKQDEENEDVDLDLIEYYKSLELEQQKDLSENHEHVIEAVSEKDGEIEMSDSTVRIAGSYRVDIGKDCSKDAIKELLKSLGILKLSLLAAERVYRILGKSMNSSLDVELDGIIYGLELDYFARSKTQELINIKRNLKKLKRIQQSLIALQNLKKFGKMSLPSERFVSATIIKNIAMFKHVANSNKNAFARILSRENIFKNANFKSVSVIPKRVESLSRKIEIKAERVVKKTGEKVNLIENKRQKSNQGQQNYAFSGLNNSAKTARSIRVVTATVVAVVKFVSLSMHHVLKTHDKVLDKGQTQQLKVKEDKITYHLRTGDQNHKSTISMPVAHNESFSTKPTQLLSFSAVTKVETRDVIKTMTFSISFINTTIAPKNGSSMNIEQVNVHGGGIVKT